VKSLLLSIASKRVAVLTLAPGIRIVVIRLVSLFVYNLVVKIFVDRRLYLKHGLLNN
jgi:hypothetical protein